MNEQQNQKKIMNETYMVNMMRNKTTQSSANDSTNFSIIFIRFMN